MVSPRAESCSCGVEAGSTLFFSLTERLSCVLRYVGGVAPPQAPYFLVVRQESRQRNVPRCRAPFGGSLLPVMPGGVFANSPCGLKHAKPFFRPSSPPVGTSEGKGNAGDQRSVAHPCISKGSVCVKARLSRRAAEQRAGKSGAAV